MDEKAKKTLLKHIPSGVYVVGVKKGESVHAFVGSWLKQVSFKPPIVMLAVKKGSMGLSLIKEAGVFSLSFLAKDKIDTVKQFFKRDSEGKSALEGIPYSFKTVGAPVLNESIGFLDCKVLTINEDLGDHAPVFAEVVEAEANENADPMIMSDTPWSYGG